MLSLEETAEMIGRLGYFMGMDFSPPVIAYIHQRFGGHPFFIRQLCSQIHKRMPLNRPRGVSLAACKEAEENSIADTQGYMSEILTNLRAFYPDEHDMIEYLAEGERSKFSEMAKYDPAYTEHLVGYGLITRRGDDYEFSFAAMEEAVKKALISRTRPLLSDKWGAISKRRNRIEEEIRGALYQWAIRLSSNDWEESVKICLTDKRKAEVGKVSRQEAFSRNNSPLYFIELLAFARHSHLYDAIQDSIGNVFKAMEVVNKRRIDAHAKDIDDDSYIELADALNLLETVFVPPA
jgi:hypothetical protein